MCAIGLVTFWPLQKTNMVRTRSGRSVGSPSSGGRTRSRGRLIGAGARKKKTTSKIDVLVVPDAPVAVVTNPASAPAVVLGSSPPSLLAV